MRVKCLQIGSILALVIFNVRAMPASDLRLIEAARNQQKEAVRAFVQQKLDVNIAGPDGTRALHWAAHWDDQEIADLLIGAGADVNAADNDGVTALWLSCINGSSSMVERLLRAGASPKAALPTGETVLMMAARTGSVSAVKALVVAGAVVNAKGTPRQQTALMWAATEGHSEVVKALLERGADVQMRSADGFTALLLGARSGQADIAEMLIGAGADPNGTADDGTTALLVATVRGHVAFARSLLAHRADPNAGPGFSPLHWAAGANFSEWGSERLSLDTKDEGSEWSVFHELPGPIKLQMINLLLDHGADPNARATRTPRYDELRPGRTSYGGDSLNGGTPFLMAAKAGDAAAARLLAQRGADPNVTTMYGTTPLMVATSIGTRDSMSPVAESRVLETLKLCVELGNNVNATNADGETALHGATYRGPMGADSLIKFLVEHGANVNVKNKRGWTPLALAEGIKFPGTNTKSASAANLLRSYGADPTPPDLERDATRARSGR